MMLFQSYVWDISKQVKTRNGSEEYEWRTRDRNTTWRGLTFRDRNPAVKLKEMSLLPDFFIDSKD